MDAKNRRKSEPPSLHAWHAVLHGSKKVSTHPAPLHHHPAAHDAPPVKTITVASLIMTPDEVYDLTARTARYKHEYPLPKLVVLGILAGAYIGLGFSLCCLVGGLLSYDLRHEQPGFFNFLFSIFGFPMGLTLCVVAGADLFTSNCMYVVVALAEGRYGILGALRTLFVSYFCNLAGALMLVGLMSAGEVYANRSDFVIELAHKKTSYPWAVAFTKGILCNWLVCLAVWQGNMARDFTGKFVGIFLPNSAFVAMGFEHSIANMFLIPMSMALGSDISVGTFISRNLVPVTLGNILGGGFFVGCMYALALGTPGHVIQDAWEEKLVRRAEHFLERRGAGSNDGSSENGAATTNGRSSAYSKHSSAGDLGGMEAGGDALGPLPHMGTGRSARFG